MKKLVGVLMNATEASEDEMMKFIEECDKNMQDEDATEEPEEFKGCETSGRFPKGSGRKNGVTVATQLRASHPEHIISVSGNPAIRVKNKTKRKVIRGRRIKK